MPMIAPDIVFFYVNAGCCRKDLWILWDNSWSVGETTFKNKVRPFLKKLINNSRLSVGPDCTHIGIITFSTQAKTKVLLKMGEITSLDELITYLNGLNYDDLKGDGTRTGMVLRMVDMVR